MLIENMVLGDKARVISLSNLPASTRMRLYGLGLHTGAAFQLKHIAPLGCPIAIQVGQTLLSLRKEEFKDVLLEKI